MSTEKVNQYKENKRKRREIAKKEKHAKILKKILCIAVLGAIGLWCAYFGHGVYVQSHEENGDNSTNNIVSASDAVVTDSAGNTYNLVQTSSGGYELQQNESFADESSDANTSINSTEENQK